jgi:hypothetical protein
MAVQRRALLIGLMGPALQGFGLMWLALHMVFAHWSGSFTARHLLYEPGALIAVAGLAVTVICVPLAIEVARAAEPELAIPIFEPTPAEPSTPPQHHAHPRPR